MNQPRQKLDQHGVKKIKWVKSIPHRLPEIVAEIDGEEVRLDLNLDDLEPHHRTALSRDSAAIAHVIVAVLQQGFGMVLDSFRDGPTTYWVRKG